MLLFDFYYLILDNCFLIKYIYFNSKYMTSKSLLTARYCEVAYKDWNAGWETYVLKTI